MDWRLFSAVTLAGASFSMVAFGAYTLRAADAVPHDAGRSAPPLLAPSLTSTASGAAVTMKADRAVSFAPVAPEGGAPNGVVAAPAAEHPAPSGMQAAAVEEVSPVPVADLLVPQEKAARSSWRHRHHATWRVSYHARLCTALRPCGTDRTPQVAVKHGDEHAAPKVALIGVGF